MDDAGARNLAEQFGAIELVAAGRRGLAAREHTSIVQPVGETMQVHHELRQRVERHGFTQARPSEHAHTVAVQRFDRESAREHGLSARGYARDAIGIVLVNPDAHASWSGEALLVPRDRGGDVAV